MRSVRGYLVGMAVLLVVVFAASALLLLRQLDAFSRAQAERQLLDTTRALSLVVDGQLQAYEGMLLALRGSQAISDGDWASFDQRARALLSGPDAWVVVGDRQGRQLVNTRLSSGAPLPAGPAPLAIWPELDRGQTRICDLSHGYIERQIVCVDVPVMRGGKAAYHLSVIFRPQLLKSVLARQSVQDGRFTTVLDRNDIVIWRNVSPERFIGASATPPLRRAMAQRAEGVIETRSLDGVPSLTAWSRSPRSGWTFVVAVPRTQILAGRDHALRYGLVGGLLLLLVSVGIAVLAGGRVAGGIKHLSAAAHRFRSRQPAAFQPSGLSEIDAVGAVLEEAFAERTASEQRLQLLMREVDHRANNLMAVVQAAVKLTRADDSAELRRIILGRIDALARAHQLLAQSRWEGADLRRLVMDEMLPFTLGDGGRVTVDGPSQPLSPAAAQGVAMAIHELATNAAKHGALSGRDGRVTVSWRIDDGVLRLRWEESGGPRVEPPTRRGFGGVVLDRALHGSVRGETRIDWRPEGVVCEIELPVGPASVPAAPPHG